MVTALKKESVSVTSSKASKVNTVIYQPALDGLSNVVVMVTVMRLPVCVHVNQAIGA